MGWSCQNSPDIYARKSGTQHYVTTVEQSKGHLTHWPWASMVYSWWLCEINKRPIYDNSTDTKHYTQQALTDTQHPAASDRILFLTTTLGECGPPPRRIPSGTDPESRSRWFQKLWETSLSEDSSMIKFVWSSNLFSRDMTQILEKCPISQCLSIL